MGNLLDVLEEGSVDILLVRLASLRGLLLLNIVALEELLLLGLLGFLLPGEVSVVEFVDLDTRQVNGRRGGDHVASIDTAERNAVDFEGSCNEKDAAAQGLKVYNALAPEPSGEDDEDGTGLKGRTQSSGADALADLLGLCVILGRVPLGGLVDGDLSFSGPEGNLLGLCRHR